MSVDRYPSNDTARRARSIRTLRPHGKPPGYQKDFTPRDKRGRPLKDREGIKKPKQIPKGLSKAAAQTVSRLMAGRIRKLVQFAPEAISGLKALDRWSDTWWQDYLPVGPTPLGELDLTWWVYSRCPNMPKEDFFSLTGFGCQDLEDVGVHEPFTGTTTTATVLYGHKYVGTYVYGPGHPREYDQMVSGLDRKSGAPVPTPVYEPSIPSPMPVVSTGTELTFEFPLEFPVPQRWSDAVAEPGTQPDGSPEPDKQPGRKDAQADTVTVPLIPGLAVVLVPVTEVAPVPETQVITVPPSPDAPVTVVTRPPPQTVSRPPKGRRLKERKLTLMAAAPMAWAIINFGTEAMDFLGVLHDALPEDLRAKKKSGWSKPKAHEMAEAVYRHYDRIDLATAVENYVNEWIEDQWFGRSGIAGKKLNQMTGNLSGADRALTQGGAGPGEAPEVHLDVHTGEWEVTTPWGNFSGNMGYAGIDYLR